MRIATFNINDINKRLPNLLAWLKTASPDIVCLQELKAKHPWRREGWRARMRLADGDDPCRGASTNPMTKPFTPPVTTSANALAIQHVSFIDIGIAPENLRAKHEADDGISRLADTIRACGVIIPLLVRAGDPKEAKPTMALDGRRRPLALQILLEAGDIAEDYQVPVIVSEGREANAAAAYLANTERVRCTTSGDGGGGDRSADPPRAGTAVRRSMTDLQPNFRPRAASHTFPRRGPRRGRSG